MFNASGTGEQAVQDFGAVTVEEHVHGGTVWVAVRARGADWSWLTPEDALKLARHWMTAYSPRDARESASG
jgi:hypothetical protein